MEKLVYDECELGTGQGGNEERRLKESISGPGRYATRLKKWIVEVDMGTNASQKSPWKEKKQSFFLELINFPELSGWWSNYW